jgi:hypothetical protein
MATDHPPFHPEGNIMEFGEGADGLSSRSSGLTLSLHPTETG